MKHLSPIAVCFIATLLSGAAIEAQQTGTVITGDLESHVNLPGLFVADDKDEIKLEPKEYSGALVVTKIVAEGATVNQGDVLIEFEPTELDEAIEEAQNEASDVGVELRKVNAEFESAKIELESKLAQGKVELSHLQNAVAAAINQQSLDLAKKVDEISDAEYQLQNALEDYEGVKQIYAERNIENPINAEILFDREERSIAKSRHRIAVLKKELAFFKKYDHSKERLKKELDVEKKKAEIKKANVNLESEVVEKEATVVKTKRKMANAQKKLDQLISDRDNLRVVAPRDGVVFYGETKKERPAGVVVMGLESRDVRKELRIGGRVTTHRILLTIAKMDRLSIKMRVSEDDIRGLEKGLSLTAFPNAYPGKSFPGTLNNVDLIATSDGFMRSERDFKVLGKCNDLTPQLRAGMNCRVCIHRSTIKNTTLVPVAAVFHDDEGFHCFVKQGDELDRRAIEIGSSNPEFAQVVDGLTAGEEVSFAKPVEQ